MKNTWLAMAGMLLATACETSIVSMQHCANYCAGRVMRSYSYKTQECRCVYDREGKRIEYYEPQEKEPYQSRGIAR